MKERFDFKKFIFALLIGAGCALTANLGALFLIPAVAVVSFIGVCWGMSYCAVAAVLMVGGVAAAYSSELWSMIAVGLAAALSAAFLTASLRKKLPYRICALVLAVLAFAALYLSLSLPSLLAGKEPYQGILDQIERIKALDTNGYLTEDLGAVGETVPYAYFGVLILLAEGAALLELLIARRLCLWCKAELRPMANFREWQLPNSLKIGLPVLAGGIILLYIVKFGGAQTVLFTALYMLLPLLIAAGAACLVYLFSRRGKSVFFTILVIFSVVLMPYFAALIGMADLYFGIRRRLILADKLIREAFEKAERNNSNTVTVDFNDGRGPQVIAVRRKRTADAFFDNNDEKPAEKKDEPAPGNGGETEGHAPSDGAAETNDKNDNGGENHEGTA